jgi:hypothetical protein
LKWDQVDFDNAKLHVKRLQKGDEEKREPDRWAVTKVRRLLHDSFLSDNEGIIDDPERAWEIILLLIDGAPFARGFSA